MGTALTAAQPATLRDYLQVLRRRKWIVLQVSVLVPLVALAFSLHQSRQYQASAQVLLSSEDLAAQLTGTQSTGISLQPQRLAQTQADLARVPSLARRVLAAVPGTGLTFGQFLSRSSVTLAANADLLTFHVTSHDPVRAEKLVDAYAAAYTTYRRRLDTASIASALAGVNARLTQIERAGEAGSALYSSLIDRQQTLLTMEALQTSNASVVKQADGITLTQPRSARNVALSCILGLLLGATLAFLAEALDTRLRRIDDVAEQLHGAPLLARLPAPDTRLRRADRLAMLDDPSSVDAEAFRVLRTNIAFARLERDVQTIMVTSALEQEGKSTTIANLAVALARAGQHVVLVDLDLRRPNLHRFFDIVGPGVTEVALGHARLDDALFSVTISDGPGTGNQLGKLEVLAAGPVPPDPGEFVASPSVGRLMSALRERAEIVLIDSAPTLDLGDAAAISRLVDGIVVVTRMRSLRRQALRELARQLSGFPAPLLGFVATDAPNELGSGYDRKYASEQSPVPQAQQAGVGTRP